MNSLMLITKRTCSSFRCLRGGSLAWLCVLAFAGLNVGCATVTWNDQLVSIDSEPRGARVRDGQSGEVIGTTPFFCEIERGRTVAFQYQVQAPEGPWRSHPPFPCRYRWVGSGLSNATLLALGPNAWPVAPLAWGLDWFTGQAFECPEQIVLKTGLIASELQAQKNATEPACPRTIVVAPYYLGSTLAKNIREHWLAESLKKGQGCFTPVPEADTRQFLEQMNVGMHSKIIPDSLSSHVLQHLGWHLNAVDMVYLDAVPTSAPRQWEVTPVQVDLHRQTIAVKKEHTYPIELDPKELPSQWDFVYDYSFSIIPNSLRFGPSNKKLEASAASGWEIAKTVTRDDLPSYFSYFDLASVNHSNAFRLWDFDLGFYPSLSFAYFKNTYNLQQQGRPQSERVEVNYTMVAPLMSGELTYHTPIGAFSVAVGIGPLITYEEERPERFRMGVTVRPGFQYMAFFTENLYFYAESYSLKIIPPEGDHLSFSSSMPYSGTGLGYFFNRSLFFF